MSIEKIGSEDPLTNPTKKILSVCKTCSHNREDLFISFFARIYNHRHRSIIH